MQADHVVSIIAETNRHELEGIDPRKIMERNKVFKPYKDWLDRKEANQKFTWTLGMYGTEAMAKEARISLKQCWEQIIKASFLDFADPVGQWQKAKTEMERVKQKLNRRLSRISKFMAETLYDENFGGKYGNVHIALGSSYKETYPKETAKVKQRQWREMGYNDSVVHTDFVSTENRAVTAYLENGQKKIIYKNGRFTI